MMMMMMILRKQCVCFRWRMLFWSDFRAFQDLGNRSKKDADQKFSTFLFVVGEPKKVTPRNMNGWNLKITQLKSGKSSEPNHHDFRFQPLIFQGVPSLKLVPTWWVECWAPKMPRKPTSPTTRCFSLDIGGIPCLKKKQLNLPTAGV